MPDPTGTPTPTPLSGSTSSSHSPSPSSLPPPPPPRKSSWRRKVLWFLFLLLFIPMLLVGMYLAVVLNVSYSEGDRTGYLQKFSRKGWICRTYEGELAMTTVPGVAPTLWTFSVWDEKVAKQINDLNLLGKRVILHYREYQGIPTSCFGETGYFVDGAKPLEDQAPPQATMP